MRHKIKHKKLGKTSTHRLSMLINMTHSLIEHEQIHTTLAKSKSLRPYIEKMITKAKNLLEKNDKEKSHKKKLLLSNLNNNSSAVNKLVSSIAPRYKTRQGGYTRIIKAGFRQGDSAPMSYIQFV